MEHQPSQERRFPMRPVWYPRKEHVALAVIFGIAVVLPIAVMGWRKAIFLVIVNVIIILVIGEHNRSKDIFEKWKKEREELLTPVEKNKKHSFDLGKK